MVDWAWRGAQCGQDFGSEEMLYLITFKVKISQIFYPIALEIVLESSQVTTFAALV